MNQTTGLYIFIVFIAIASFQFLYILVQYFFNRKTEYLYYLGYILCIISYSVIKHETPMNFTFFGKVDKEFENHWDRALPIIAYFLYYRFGRYFLDLKSNFSKLKNQIQKTEYITLAYVLFELFWEYAGLNRNLSEYIFISISTLLTFITGYFIYKLIRYNIPLISFIIAGVIIIHIGALVTLVSTFLLRNNAPYYQLLLPFHISVIIELIIFTSGLAYKSKQIEKQKVASQKELISQLEKNIELRNALTKTQTEIAQEMHDEIGSNLSSIKIYTGLALKETEDKNSQASLVINKAYQLSVEVMDYMSDMLYALNPEHHTAEKLKQRLMEYCREYLLPVDTPFSIEIHCDEPLSFSLQILKDWLPAFRHYFKNIPSNYKDAIHIVIIKSTEHWILECTHIHNDEAWYRFKALPNVLLRNGLIPATIQIIYPYY